jgi:hypothetical protein
MQLLSHMRLKIIPIVYFNSIDRLVPLLGMNGVPCEMRNEVLCIIYVNIDLRKNKRMFIKFPCHALRRAGMWRCDAGSAVSSTPKKIPTIFKCSKYSWTSESLTKKVAGPFETSGTNNLTSSQKTEIFYYIPAKT